MSITKFEIHSRDGTTGWDISRCSNNIKWTTDLNFTAGTFTFDVINNANDFYPQNGQVVEFAWNDQQVFYGYIFKVSYMQDKKFSITAYDKMRYLKNQDSLVWPISNISERFDTVCKRAEITHNVVNSSDYKLPAEVADSKSYFDMLKSAIDKTQKATQQMFYVYANYDTVELRKAPFQQLDIIIGDQSLLTGFSFEKNIDNASNVVRIVKEDKQSSQQVSATASENSGGDPNNTSFSYVDSAGSSVSQWGKLQMIEKAKDKANEAQMKQRADELLQQKNREEYDLKLDTLGHLNLVAGNAINIKIQSLTDVGFKINNAAILKATHNFSIDYTCELEMKVNPQWLESNS
ncbi:late control protein D [Bombilactobacillus bombi]|uniref:Late control protein D n=1 Tax=Bombilactobacillus bombi TaxID=1303590 RepID=A0A3R6XUH8_9LACO|nr:late control protein D [Bombilactobacillus bombi]RHW49725.1 late control protein D [Bombilactobacillus bombi]